MAQPYLGEIRLYPGPLAPPGWMSCTGGLLGISGYDELFMLIGTTYGGDGETTFGIPDLSGRVAIGTGRGPDGTVYSIGEISGTEEVTLSVQQIPNHTHPFTCTTDVGKASGPANAVLAQSTLSDMYIQDSPDGTLATGAVQEMGKSLPHTNVQPFLCLHYIIATTGIFPTPA